MSADGDRDSAQELVLRALEHRESLRRWDSLLTALVRELGLFPYLNPDELSMRDLLAYETHRPDALDDATVFHGPQARVYWNLMHGDNIALSAPASFGKSLIIDAVIASGKFANVVIVVPTIALIDETRKRLTSRFRDRYKIITQVNQPRSDRNIFVFTQERVLQSDGLSDVDFFVIDEFYKMDPRREDENRWPLLNQAFYKLRKTGAQFYLLGPNIRGIAQNVLDRIEFRFIRETYTTVVSDLHPIDRGADEMSTLAELCSSLEGRTIVYVRSPQRASDVARHLVSAGVGSHKTGMAEAVGWIREHIHPEWHVAAALENGIGVHHGRIPRSIAQYIVKQFNDQELDFLVCTSTIIEGVNTSARNMIILDSRVGRQSFDYFTFNNIRGRAGRMFEHFVGRVFIFEAEPQEGLPELDIPVISQTDRAPESLLIQLDDDDLSGSARERIEPYRFQDLLSFETMRGNVGIDPDRQLQLAEELSENLEAYHARLRWSGRPNFEQLRATCVLIWSFFDGSRLAPGSITSAVQLATLINRLRARPTVATLVRDQATFLRSDDYDQVVGRILDFLRLWAGFHFPRLLRAVDAIQRDVFSRHGREPGDYESYAAQVENLFTDAAIVALDEFGIPLEIARALEGQIAAGGDLDQTIANLKSLDLRSTELSHFERRLVAEALEFM